MTTMPPRPFRFPLPLLAAALIAGTACSGEIVHTLNRLVSNLKHPLDNALGFL